jgi:hypothetical protein
VNLIHFFNGFGVEGHMVRTWFVSIIAEIAVLWTGGPNLDSERNAPDSFKSPTGARRVRAGELGREPLGPTKPKSREQCVTEGNRSRRIAY